MTAEEKKQKKVLPKLSKTSKEYQRLKACKICGTYRGVIQKYNLRICRRCFNDIAFDLGFKKYD
jgi:small subunit ribosomal protein S14